MNFQRHRRTPLVALGISSIFHAAAFYGAFGVLHHALPDPSQRRPVAANETREVFVDVLPKQMVESEVADNRLAPKESRFVGARSQTVEKPTAAPVLGAFRAGRGETGTSLAPDNDLKSNLASNQSLTMKDLITSDGPSEDRIAMDSELQAMSATDDRLDGIATGARTLLATKESKYFGFFQRSKRQLKAQWEKEIASGLLRDANRRETYQRSRWSTRVLATLDRSGRVQNVVVTRSSDSAMLDEAARQAFLRVAILHNPPRGLFREDGQLFLPWEFNAHVPKARRQVAQFDDSLQRFRRLD